MFFDLASLDDGFPEAGLEARGVGGHGLVGLAALVALEGVVEEAAHAGAHEVDVRGAQVGVVEEDGPASYDDGDGSVEVEPVEEAEELPVGVVSQYLSLLRVGWPPGVSWRRLFRSRLRRGLWRSGSWCRLGARRSPGRRPVSRVCLG